MSNDEIRRKNPKLKKLTKKNSNKKTSVKHERKKK